MIRTADVLVLAAVVAGCAPARAPVDVPADPSAVPLVGAGFPPTAAEARTRLAALEVAWGKNRQTYERSAFGDGWSDETDAPGGRNGCDTRDDVLRRDLTEVRLGDRNRYVVLSGVLLATDKQTNQEKSSKTPDKWRPPAYGVLVRVRPALDRDQGEVRPDGLPAREGGRPGAPRHLRLRLSGPVRG
ncbi:MULTISPECIES: hypothetical protein [Streptomyces]|uniref:hypothetical protein n=1 Tax=Streptomyces TaxID=1883 RepID=UPI001CC250E9|nr:hypothetical protein [Streptomyces venezuelae]